MSTPSFSGAIDLSGLSAQTTVTSRQAPPAPAFEIPPGAFACEVEGGCNLVIMGDGSDHTTQKDCVDTVLPYVEKYLMTREASIEVAEEYHKAVNVTRQVLAANQRLAEENDRLKSELREARKGTPAAEKHVLAGAADLAASMKANFGPKEQETAAADKHDWREDFDGKVCTKCGAIMSQGDDARANGPCPKLAAPEADDAMSCKRCGKDDTEFYEMDGVPYLWCKTCQDDAGE